MCNKGIWVFLLLMLLLPLSVSAEAAWENERYEMQLDEETLIFTVTSKGSGAQLHSAVVEADKSLNKQWSDFLCSSVAIEYAQEDATATTRIGLIRSEAEWTIDRAADGFDAHISFSTCMIQLTLQVRLTDDGVVMTVPADSIVENGADLLCGVHIAPAMGATLLDAHEGYLFIPEAAGAIIRYRNGDATSTTPYSKPVYGDNLGVDEPMADRENYPSAKEGEKILAPVYGFAHEDEGLAALFILESGQDNAEIYAYPSGVVTQYNFAGSLFVLRDRYFRLNSATRGAMVFERAMQSRDLTVRVCLLEGEAANYSGMALRYRRYLQEQQGLLPVADTGALRLDFLAAETEKGVLFNKTVTVTTVDELQRITQAFVDAGVDQIDAYYVGWQKGGKTAGFGQTPSALDSSLGDWDELRQAVQGDGCSLSLAQDLLLAFQDRTYARDTLARRVNRENMFVYTKRTAYPRMSILSPLVLDQYADALANAAGDTMGLSVSGISNTLFSHAVSSTEAYTRLDTLGANAAVFAALTQGCRLALEQPFACYLPYADAYLNMPLETTNYSLIDEAVPFLPMALDGLVECWSEPLNFSADPSYTLLRLVEYGVNPSYLLTEQDTHILQDTNSDNVYAAQWEGMMPRILETYEALAPAREVQTRSGIVGHARLTEDVVCLTYANGAQIFINYGSSTYQAPDGQPVEALSYRITGGVE